MTDKCIWGRGSLGDVEVFLNDFLRETGCKPRVTRSGRFYEYYVGFRKKITMIYYHSDNSFKICGPEEIIEKLRVKLQYSKSLRLEETPIIHTGLGEYFDPLNQIYKLLDKREVLVKKCYMCQKTIPLVLLAFIVFIVIALLYGKSITEILPVALILLLILSIIPLGPRHMHNMPHVQIILCWKYKKQLRKITNEINKLLIYIPEKHPAREEITRKLKYT